MTITMRAPMPLARFKSVLKRGELPGLVTVRKQSAAIIEPLPGRQLRFTISTGAIDRDNDAVSVNGWDLRAFSRNPVVLWSHDADELPIARCIEIGVVGDALKAVADFAPAEMPIVGELAEAVLRMCRTGFLSATSVGFRPLEFELAKDRDDDEDSWWPPINFLRQELMEFSIVSIPANPDALIDPAYVS
jgi:Caudovirus prohead serine protease